MSSIKKIAIAELEVGMFIEGLINHRGDKVDLGGSFLLQHPKELQQLSLHSVRQVLIDTRKGKAPAPACPIDDFKQRREQAKQLVIAGSAAVNRIMDSVRLGEQIDMTAMDEVAANVTDSLTDNPHMLLSVARLKTRDLYTFQHSVSVAALMSAFAKSLGHSQQLVYEVALGGLLHDVGKAKVPLEILNKPGRLDEQEFAVMRQHSRFSYEVLKDIPDFPAAALQTAAMHHERPDGRGYPFGLKGEQIPEVGHMSAIVDVYDALTSVRVYKDAWEPTETLRKMMQWGAGQFDIPLLQKFIKMLGVYPVGAFVQTQSQHVGVVIAQNPDLTRPVLNIVYDCRRQSQVPAETVNLSEHPADGVDKAVNPEDFGLRAADYL